MRSKSPYSLTRRIGLVFTITLAFVFAYLGYVEYARIAERVLEDELNRLQNIVYRFEEDLSGLLDVIHNIETDDSLDREDRVLAIHTLLQPVVELHTAATPSSALGYYSKHLEAVVATSPWDEMGHTLGIALEPNHPAVQLYSGDPIQRNISEVLRGHVARYARLVYWQGHPVGHTWASIPIEIYYSKLTPAIIRISLVLLIAISSLTLLLRFVLKEITRSAETLGEEMDSLASGSPTYAHQATTDHGIPVEFHPLFRRFAQMSKRVQRLTNELAQSTRLAAFGELATVIVHDIKNPLAAITATAQLGKITAPESAKCQERFGHIIEASEELDNYLKKVLVIAKDREGCGEPVSIASVINNTLYLWEPMLDRNDVRLEVSIADALPPVTADRAALQQVFLNLLKNAVEAMPSGGEMVLAAAQRRDGVQISISDTGHGIPEDIQPSIFEKFFTTKDQGTGVGLAAAHAFVSELGGEIWFESTPGEGTTFYLQLPVRSSSDVG